MNEYVFTFQSMTAAQQAAIILTKEGIPAQLIRAPKQVSSYGCSHAVRVPHHVLQKTMSALYRASMNWERIFLMTSQMRAEEVML